MYLFDFGKIHRSRFDKLSANGFYKGYSKFAKVQLFIIK
jgi:hypothetical protein